jgi:hypothetical protein
VIETLGGNTQCKRPNSNRDGLQRVVPSKDFAQIVVLRTRWEDTVWAMIPPEAILDRLVRNQLHHEMGFE